MTVVNARFPWVLFLPLATLTEVGGVVLLLTGRGIGWAAILAPVVGFLAMRGPVRPRFEFNDDGVIFISGSLIEGALDAFLGGGLNGVVYDNFQYVGNCEGWKK